MKLLSYGENLAETEIEEQPIIKPLRESPKKLPLKPQRNPFEPKKPDIQPGTEPAPKA